MDDNDEGARIGLWVALGVVALLLFGLLGGLAIRGMNTKHVTVGADLLVDGALSGEIVARLFFDLDKSDLQADADSALAAAARSLSDAPGKKLLIAGFHDPSGNPAHNAELAKQRAKAVRAALVAAGTDAARVLMRKPEQTALGGPPDEARRVEVRLVD